MPPYSQMVRLGSEVLLAGVLGLAAAGSVVAQSGPDDPPRPRAEVTPTQRLLTDADAQRAQVFKEQIDELEGAGRFVEALAPAREVAALRTRVQGAEHWQAADAARRVRTLAQVAALPAAARGELAAAIKLDVVGRQLLQQRGHAEAEPLLREALAIRRRVLGGDHPDTATSLHNLAVDLDARGQYAEAEPLLREALAIRRRVLGVDHPDTAASLIELAFNLDARGQYAEAEPLLREALAICRRVLGDDHPQTATSLNNLARNLDARGKYSEAEPLLRQALEINRHVLGAEHADTANSLNNLALNLDARGQRAAAEPLLREALEIYRRDLGTDHPQTVSILNNLAVNLANQGKYSDAEPLLRQALVIRRRVLGADHPDTAISLINLAANLHERGQYAAAEPLSREALAIHRRVLGADHPQTVSILNNLAVNLDDQGKYSDAEPLLREALAIRRRVLGTDHPDTATSLKNLARNLHARGQYAEAEPLLRAALAIRRRVLGDGHPHTATSLNDLAINLDARGQYSEAELLFRDVLAICRRVLGDDHPDTATSLNNLARTLDARGKYSEAEPLLRQALEINRHVLGASLPQTASILSNLALNLDARGQHAAAEPLLREALEIHRRILGADRPQTASIFISNLAGNLDYQGKYSEAEPLLREALEMMRRVLGADHPDTANILKILALTLYVRGKYSEAETMCRQASQSFEAARLRFSFAGLDRAAFATEHSPLALLAALLARRGQAADAWQHLEANLARGLLDDLSARMARPLDANERHREQALVGQLHRLDEQIAALGQDRDRPEERRAQQEAVRARRDTLQAEFSQFEADLVKKYGPAAGQVYDLARIQVRLPDDAALVAWLDIKSGPKAADPNGEHWACLVRRRGVPTWVRLPGSGPKGAWIDADDRLPVQVYQALTRPPDDPSADWREPARRLVQQRLDPLRPHLGGEEGLPAVRRLIILPSRAMMGMPVEALVEAQPGDSPQYSVSYAPSGTMFAWLQERRQEARDEGRGGKSPRLLALGDPAFERPDEVNPPAPPPPDQGVLITFVPPGSNAARGGLKAGDVILNYAGVKLTDPADLAPAIQQRGEPLAGAGRDEAAVSVTVWREGQTLERTVRPGPLGAGIRQGPAAAAILAQRAGDTLLRRTRGEPFAPLPGTRREVQGIARLFDRPEVLLGSDASEQRLDQLAASGRLREFDFLLLATHGVFDPQVAMHSALILAQDRLPDSLERVLAGQDAYDGRVTAEQILRTWKLDAELVTLSACQTALGKPSGGEGFLGFSQALFLAGSRTVVLSLWKVDDQATSLLMTRFYQNLLGRRAGLSGPLGKAEALREAKQWLRSLPAEEVGEELAALDRGSTRKLIMAPKPPQPEAGASQRPAVAGRFAHPYYWAAFILIGDPW
jgi:tetratricopeptide (TPR) repeat protein